MQLRTEKDQLLVINENLKKDAEISRKNLEEVIFITNMTKS